MLKLRWKIDKKKDKDILFFTFVWGILTHGIMFFNKFSFFDELHYMFGVGHTYPLGRWMLGIMESITKFLFGSGLFSLPVLNGGISLLCLAVAICIIVRILEIENRWGIIVICGVMVAFPTITCMFAYMYTAPYYMVGFLLGVIGIGCVCSEKMNIVSLLTGAILFACAIGVYQAFIPFMLCLLLIYFMNEILKNRINNWYIFARKTVYLGSFCGLALAIYYLVLQVFLKCLKLKLSGYKGANEDGLILSNLNEYKWRVILAYQEFFQPSEDGEYLFWNMYPWNMQKIYYILIALIALVSIFFIIYLGKENIMKSIWFVLLLMLLPLGINFIFIMVNKWSVYALTNYSQVMIFVFFVWLIENVKMLKINWGKWIYGGGIALILFSGISYSRYANVCYLNAELMRNQMISYYTTLITRIQSGEGYREELPIVFINGGQKESLDWAKMEEFQDIAIEAYRWDVTINDNSWVRFMEYYCGYAPTMIEDVTMFEDMQEVKEMPCYPNDGSIQIINDTIIVKF